MPHSTRTMLKAHGGAAGLGTHPAPPCMAGRGAGSTATSHPRRGGYFQEGTDVLCHVRRRGGQQGGCSTVEGTTRPMEKNGKQTDLLICKICFLPAGERGAAISSAASVLGSRLGAGEQTNGSGRGRGRQGSGVQYCTLLQCCGGQQRPNAHGHVTTHRGDIDTAPSRCGRVDIPGWWAGLLAREIRQQPNKPPSALLELPRGGETPSSDSSL